MRKTFIALFALAAVGLIQPTVTSAHGGDQWAIRHETLNLFDAARQRPVAVDVAVRRDYEMKAGADCWKLPVAIISNGNTVKNTWPMSWRHADIWLPAFSRILRPTRH